jgi:UDP-N-acetyl-D-mannosaminuronic acid transferase (WecB/TagA/CpsF family)
MKFSLMKLASMKSASMDPMTAATKPGARAPERREGSSFHTILGVPFFSGDAREAVQRMQAGGLLVVPAAPALTALPASAAYRDALTHADLAIADSGLMVLVWNLLQSKPIRKLSGLAYLRELLQSPVLRQAHAAFWVMPDPAGAASHVQWLQQEGIPLSADDTYIAPVYGDPIADGILLDRLRMRRPQHIVVALGGGTQERLGLYLKANLDYRPAIHCIGAAIAFLSGAQVRIPVWADQAYLGWLFRCISNPASYVPRYWQARKLVGLLLKYRERLPVDERMRSPMEDLASVQAIKRIDRRQHR